MKPDKQFSSTFSNIILQSSATDKIISDREQEEISNKVKDTLLALCKVLQNAILHVE